MTFFFTNPYTLLLLSSYHFRNSALRFGHTTSRTTQNQETNTSVIFRKEWKLQSWASFPSLAGCVTPGTQCASISSRRGTRQSSKVFKSPSSVDWPLALPICLWTRRRTWGDLTTKGNSFAGHCCQPAVFTIHWYLLGRYTPYEDIKGLKTLPLSLVSADDETTAHKTKKRP